tara:strand:+ start:1436 stop:2083 length:648 start_codon:yes stop_codon:yes gene_type:complete
MRLFSQRIFSGRTSDPLGQAAKTRPKKKPKQNNQPPLTIANAVDRPPDAMKYSSWLTRWVDPEGLQSAKKAMNLPSASAHYTELSPAQAEAIQLEEIAYNQGEVSSASVCDVLDSFGIQKNQLGINSEEAGKFYVQKLDSANGKKDVFIYQFKFTNDKKHYDIISILPALDTSSQSEPNQVSSAFPMVTDYDINRFLNGRNINLNPRLSFNPYLT